MLFIFLISIIIFVLKNLTYKKNHKIKNDKFPNISDFSILKDFLFQL
ncbi:glycerophosphoryl diester phosphodiesterase family protein [Streptococcus agalactiae CNCTC 10/84]|nr:glycerophosphoryl diester phosphodiesterase family protein [Streptococcus agalactiae CNCTC 10/84]AKI56910.1 Hypothetical Protein GBS85147_0479 [Streptococcus agalactiae]CCW39376.1 hypothetical protein MSA_5130 [Streptococcus agalactiae ILRI005]APU54533.1 hypothetical protein [Streptococcus agalactiae]APU54547.1 hypothetical protein [Streptococcus agalactiae]